MFVLKGEVFVHPSHWEDDTGRKCMGVGINLTPGQEPLTGVNQKRRVLILYTANRGSWKPFTTATAKGTHRFRCVHSAIQRCD
jgi:hypothetical protein